MADEPQGKRVATLAADGVVAVVAGYGALDGVADTTLAWPLSFAGGAVLASLADTLMPEAYRDGGPGVAYATAIGFLLTFMVAFA